MTSRDRLSCSMNTSNFSEELDFRLLFDEDSRRTAGLDVRTSSTPTQALNEQLLIQELPPTTDHFQHVQGPQYEPQYGTRTAFDCPSIQITSITPINHMEPGSSQEALTVGGAEGGYPNMSGLGGQLYLPRDPCYRDTALCASPCSSLSSRSWMSDLSSCESFSHVYDDVEGELHSAAHLTLGSPIGSHQGSPGYGGEAFGVELWQQKYQHPLAFSPALSPHQSPCQSPCHSPRTSVTEDSWLNRRPTSRPSSRPTSPCGKRRHVTDPYPCSPSPHHSASPTPGTSPRGSVIGDTCVGSPASSLGSLLMSGLQHVDIPSKTRRTSGCQRGLLANQGESGAETLLESHSEEGHQRDGPAEFFLQVPSHFNWNKPKPGNAPLFSKSSPPPLDWPLPNQFDQYELKLEVQPRSYHRAHYETEGSRGSIKAAPVGHPVVKLTGYSGQPLSLLLFIGTADEHVLRPHSFYQVHRVTGKMVTTSCQERMMDSTKVLEIPLLPDNDMSTSIDCAGILKLRNADIELMKGEMDIGRKNTRVRVVIRAAVPQLDGRMLWLQTASVPVECSQRSGQQLPVVESFSPACCSVDGGQELLINGSNMSPSSRVVFTETGPDGRSLWETDARVVPEKSSGSSIVVEVPAYNKKATDAVQVQFYVSNRKKTRSQPQAFTYLPRVRSPLPAAAALEQERWNHISHNLPGLCPTPCQTFIMPTPMSSLPLQTLATPPQRDPFICLSSRRTAVTPAAPPKDSLISNPGGLQSIKQEPEDPTLTITLDDVNEIIDRDIGNQPDQYNQ